MSRLAAALNKRHIGGSGTSFDGSECQRATPFLSEQDGLGRRKALRLRRLETLLLRMLSYVYFARGDELAVGVVLAGGEGHR
jgi:hypothetical protein